MKASAVRLAAIWWAPETTGPSRAMNKAMKVKAVTSARKVRPMGMPRRRNAAMAFGSGPAIGARRRNSA
jgi:hypothetical protein